MNFERLDTRIGLHNFAFHNTMNITRPDDSIDARFRLSENEESTDIVKDNNGIPDPSRLIAEAEVVMRRSKESSVS